MATTFHVLSTLQGPRLWIWRDRTSAAPAELAYDATATGVDAEGFHTFQAVLDHQIHEHAHALLHTAEWKQKEDSAHARTLPRTASYRFPRKFWLVEGTSRVVTRNPFSETRDSVRIHLITANRYRGGRLFLWSPGVNGRFVAASGSDATGPYFDVTLRGRERHFFLFKFVSREGNFEPDYANRLWVADDGSKIWVHSQASGIAKAQPRLRNIELRVFDFGAPGTSELHLWQEDSDFAADLSPRREASGWLRYQASVYSGLPYRFMLKNAALDPVWEHEEAKRNLILHEDGSIWTTSGDGSARQLGSSVWTFEGDHELFGSEPTRTHELIVEVAVNAPDSGLTDASGVDVWVNRARRPLHQNLTPTNDGRFHIRTYSEIVTSLRFRDGTHVENVERHFIKLKASDAPTLVRYAVLGRADLLLRAPIADTFSDPPFDIERPGVWVVGNMLRCAVHCPTAASVELVGEWTHWQSNPIPLRSTLDGTYFWCELPLSAITTPLGRGSIHGTFYKFLLNQVRQVQDPAADWVENSDPERASKLVDHSLYHWQSNSWQRPTWDWLIVYQLHPSRFTRRASEIGLDAITHELVSPNGYLDDIGATALLLMPTCEFAGDLGWGYNPSFFYSVESSYGGPDALKRLVDTCHQHGKAVLLDVVFNHAGASDNVLWSVARESFFDGDTEWGAMINFDHPQVRHFFERNLVHFLDKYRIDGFRFDFTRVIRHGGTWTDFVRAPGSGGGWEFMHGLRRAVRAFDPRCLFMAENLPNEWDLTRYGGPMDTQWCDEFHDRLVDASRGWSVLDQLAAALRATHTYCNQWYEATNYPESHDEVGNEPNRIAHVAGIGQGYRRNKLAAATTLLARGIPMWFMGAESGEWRQFSKDTSDTLDLDDYQNNDSAIRLRNWWNALCNLRRGNNRIQGPSPIDIRFVDQSLLAFSRGDAADLFVLLNFGNSSTWRSLAELNLPDADYKELLNSTWGDYRIAAESEDEHSNGGWSAHLRRNNWIQIPDYGVVVLERH
ncbi:MAG: alpha-amylase family glycosyl hydrolase [Myxococcota bacterium]